MSLIDDLNDLGFNVESQRPVAQDPDTDLPVAERTLQIGSPTARALYEICLGTRIVIIKSPPGGGKSTLMSTVVAHLVNTMDETVTVAVNTHEQIAAMVHKVAEQVPAELISYRSGPATRHIKIPGVKTDGTSGRVNIRTLASLAASTSSKKGNNLRGLLLIDEAYQSHFTAGITASSDFDQLVLVGDPGQIHPVITARVDAFEHIRRGPHRPFAAVMESDSRSVVIDVKHTYRLGEASADLVAPFYDFGFVSRRADTWVERGGERLPEMTGSVLRSDKEFMVARQVADIVATHIGARLHVDGLPTRAVVGKDIAVVVALNTTLTAVRAALNAAGLADVSVGTADKLQGGQWPVVIGVDPLSIGTPGAHHVNTGRLCVMLSRHSARLIFVSPGNWRDLLSGMPNEAVHVAVRKKLMKASQP